MLLGHCRVRVGSWRLLPTGPVPDYKGLFCIGPQLPKHCWSQTAQLCSQRRRVLRNGENINALRSLPDPKSQGSIQGSFGRTSPSGIPADFLRKIVPGDKDYLKESKRPRVYCHSKVQGHPQLHRRRARGAGNRGESSHEKGTLKT